MGFVVVTHSFHPLIGQRLEVLYLKRRAGDTVFVCSGGVSGQITVPLAWTDMNPAPPDLKEVVGERQPRELFWIVKNGIKMTGMPSFGAAGVPDPEIWSIVAFLKKLPTVTDADFKTWSTSAP